MTIIFDNQAFCTLFSIAVHIMLFASIFDIYFTSSIYRGLQSYSSKQHSSITAKRVVLIVADGLRAEKLYENNMINAPFLYTIVKSRTSWGISHTRVPTESRPGHVAVIAGFYEDVASVTKGWKENAVEFDSIVNRSYHTWAWGSPDIVPMFTKHVPHAFYDTYNASDEDFKMWDTTELDDWVFKKVKNFFINQANKNVTLHHLLQQDGLVFFLHLLGLDTVGHSDKPTSQSYAANIRFVDKHVSEIVDIMESFWGHDNRTAYVFTSDHGMTDWGSHGAGSQDETVTPFITWGAGTVSSDMLNGNAESDVESCVNFFPGCIRNLRQGMGRSWPSGYIHQIEQADLCPLMAVLGGLHIPTNSIGLLPLQILNFDRKHLSYAIRANALQIMEQWKAKRIEVIEKSFQLTFVEFSKLTPLKAQALLLKADELSSLDQFTEAIKLYQELCDLGLQTLHYFHKYHRFSLGVCITTCYLMWMLFVMFHLIYKSHITSSNISVNNNLRSGSRMSWTMFYAVYACLSVLLLWQLWYTNSSIMHGIYWFILLILSCFLVSFSCFTMPERKCSVSTLLREIRITSWFDVVHFLMYLLVLELLIWSFFYRYLLSWSVIFHCFAVALKRHVSLWSYNEYVWITSCFALAAFPMLPVIGGTMDRNLVLFGGLLTFGYAVLQISYLHIDCISHRRILYLQLFLLFVTSFIPWYVHGLTISAPTWCLSLSWIISGCCFPLTIAVQFSVYKAWKSTEHNSPYLYVHLISLWLAVSTMYMFTSIYYEPFFLLVFCGVLFAWLKIETIQLPVNISGDSIVRDQPRNAIDNLLHKLKESTKYVSKYFPLLTADNHICIDADNDVMLHHTMIEFSLQKSLNFTSQQQDNRTVRNGATIRHALSCVFFVTFSFFGTGNIASLNSFDVHSVYCFVTLFRPFVMAAILIYKIILPMLIVCIVYVAISLITSSSRTALRVQKMTSSFSSILLSDFFPSVSMMIADFMALHFFFLVRDEGSWLDIGTSISHYVIGISLTLIVPILTVLARLLMYSDHDISHYSVSKWL